jgi:hypothetical protein
MKQELQPLLIELCHFAVTRNAINTRRHRARFRKNYYAHAVRVVEAHNRSNYELRHLDPKRHGAKIAHIKEDMAWLREKHPKPKKWQTMGLHKLRSLVLQGTGEYAMAKHETMEFTIKHRIRVKFLTETLNCIPCYNNGSIDTFLMKDLARYLYQSEIDLYASQYELNKAVEGMLK